MKFNLAPILIATSLSGAPTPAKADIIVNQTDLTISTILSGEEQPILSGAEQLKQEELEDVLATLGGIGLGAGALLGAGAIYKKRRDKKTGPSDMFLGQMNSSTSEAESFSPDAWPLYQAIRTHGLLHEIKVGEHYFHLSDRYIGERENVLGFVLFGGKYHPRYFYYSESGGNWHCGPAFHGRTVSKGNINNKNGMSISMGYESGTILHDDMSKFISVLPLSSKESPVNILGKDSSLFNKGLLYQEEYAQLYSGEMITDRVLGNLTKDGVYTTRLFTDSQPFAKIFGDDSTEGLRDISLSELYLYFHQIPVPAEILTHLAYSSAGKIWTHRQLGTQVSSVLYTSKFAGKNIIIEYAIGEDKPESPWIENIYYKNATISTWGFLREQINPGILRTKPIEYVHQCPKCIQEIGIRHGQYVDIREYTQGNPLIQKYKELGNTL